MTVKIFILFLFYFFSLLVSDYIYAFESKEMSLYSYGAYCLFDEKRLLDPSYEFGVLVSKQWTHFGFLSGLGLSQTFDRSSSNIKSVYLPCFSFFLQKDVFDTLFYDHKLFVSLGGVFGVFSAPFFRLDLSRVYGQRYQVNYGVGFGLDKDLFFMLSFRPIDFSKYILVDDGFLLDDSRKVKNDDYFKTSLLTDIQSKSLNVSTSSLVDLVGLTDEVVLFRFSSRSFKDMHLHPYEKDVQDVSKTGVFDSYSRFFKPKALMTRYDMFQWVSYLNLYWKFFDSHYLDLLFDEDSALFIPNISISLLFEDVDNPHLNKYIFNDFDLRHVDFRLRWFYQFSDLDEGDYNFCYQYKNQDAVILAPLKIDIKRKSFRSIINKEFNLKSREKYDSYVSRFSSHFFSSDRLLFSQKASKTDLIILLGRLMNSYSKVPLFLDDAHDYKHIREEDRRYFSYFLSQTGYSSSFYLSQELSLTRVEAAHLISLAMKWFDSFFSKKEFR